MGRKTGADVPQAADAERSLCDVLEAHRRGEPAAIGMLLEACRSQMEKLARRMLGGHPEIRRGFGDTCDVTQQAWFRLANALQSVRPESTLHLMRLATLQVRREMIDLVRKYGGPRSPVRGEVSNVVIADTQAIDLVDQAFAPSESLTSLDVLSRFHEAVDSLPEHLRDVFTMRYYLDATVTSIADAVGCDRRTVKRRWAKAKESLRTVLMNP